MPQNPPPAPEPHILVVSGSTRVGSKVQRVAEHAAEHARRAGGLVHTLDLAEVRLPLMESGASTQQQAPEVVSVRDSAQWADGFILVTPEYHGGMSGTLKNWFDFLYLELAGKFAGVLAVAGGASGDMSITAVKNAFSWCHGFTLPFHAAARNVDFTPDGELVEAKVLDRIERIAHDVVRYAPVIRAAFEQARALGPKPHAGVAGVHAEDDDD